MENSIEYNVNIKEISFGLQQLPEQKKRRIYRHYLLHHKKNNEVKKSALSYKRQNLEQKTKYATRSANTNILFSITKTKNTAKHKTKLENDISFKQSFKIFET